MAGLTKKQFEKEMAELARAASNLSPLPEAGKQERLRRSLDDKVYFAQTYFPDYVSIPFADAHLDMFDLADDKITPQLILGYRGLGKSVNVSLIDAAHKVCHRVRRFLVYCSENADKAEQEFTGPLRTVLEHNTRIQQDFGDLSTRGHWEYGDFTTVAGVRVKAISWRQSPRSLRNGPHRPDHILFVDIENPREGDSPRIITRKATAIQRDFIGGAELTNCSIIYEGNYVRKPSVASTLVEGDEFATHIYRLLEPHDLVNSDVLERFKRTGELPEGVHSTWPEKFPLETIREIVQKIGVAAILSEFQQIPDSEGTYYKDEWRQTYRRADINLNALDLYCWADPRGSDKQTATGSDDAAVVIGFDRDTMNAYVLFAWARQASAKGFVEKQYEIYEWLHPAMAVEENTGRKFLKDTYDHVAQETGYRLPMHYRSQNQQKEGRILGKSSWVENGWMHFLEGDPAQERLWQQLKATPNWTDGNDLADCWAGAIELYEWMSGGGNRVDSEVI